MDIKDNKCIRNKSSDSAMQNANRFIYAHPRKQEKERGEKRKGMVIKCD